MSPRTGFVIVASTRSIRLPASTVAVALKLPGPEGDRAALHRALAASAALMTPCGVDQSWN